MVQMENSIIIYHNLKNQFCNVPQTTVHFKWMNYVLRELTLNQSVKNEGKMKVASDK